MLTGANIECPPGKVTGIYTSCFYSSYSKQWTKVSSRSRTTVILSIISECGTFEFRVLRHIYWFILCVVWCVIVLSHQLKEENRVEYMISDQRVLYLIVSNSLGHIVNPFSIRIFIGCFGSFWLFHTCDNLFDHHGVILFILNCSIIWHMFPLLFFLNFIIITRLSSIIFLYSNSFLYWGVIRRSLHSLEQNPLPKSVLKLRIPRFLLMMLYYFLRNLIYSRLNLFLEWYESQKIRFCGYLFELSLCYSVSVISIDYIVLPHS